MFCKTKQGIIFIFCRSKALGQVVAIQRDQIWQKFCHFGKNIARVWHNFEPTLAIFSHYCANSHRCK